jgi:hypothetical protein
LIHSLPENRFQSVNADFVQIFSDSGKKFIYRPELLSLEAVFEMFKQETRNKKQETRSKKNSEGAKSGEYGRCGCGCGYGCGCGCGAIRKKLLL